MPLNIDFLQILLHAFNFLILAGGLVLILYKPVKKFLDERNDYYEAKEAEIKERAEENERLREEYESKLMKAQEEIAELRISAEKDISDNSKAILQEAKEKAQDIIVSAEREAEDRKEHILDSAQTEIGELVVAATQKLLSDTVTPERNTELYDEFIRLADKTIADKRLAK